MQKRIIGWDVGGAHIKAAVLDPNGKIIKVIQQPCPLWKGIEHLTTAITEILTQISGDDLIHAITMTGELVDLFDNRDEGVEKIIQTMQSALSSDVLFFYAGLEGFIPVEEIKQPNYISIASANWLASASLIATKIKEGLFIDIGSTTTDILLISDHKVQIRGMTDYDRMRSDELVYTGIVRTAVMAVVQSALFKGQNMGLMAEYFATMADVYRLTGELNEYHDQAETADGAEKTELASGKRLSRMVGHDFSEDDLALWQQFAQTIKIQQKTKIEHACEKQLSRRLVSDEVIFIGAGIGRFLVEQISSNLGYTYQDFSVFFAPSLAGSEMDLADCAPAVSVALLYSATS